ncbi:MAG: trypsin-like peptidase domain-containing protein [Pseudomonadota bacterium]
MTLNALTDIETQREEFKAARRTLMMLGYEESRLEAISKVAKVIDEADDLGAEGVDRIMDLAQALQDKRAFGLMLVLCVMAARADLGSPALLQKEIQALIELGRLPDALRRAKILIAATADADPGTDAFKTWLSAKGNLGRAYKQAYMNAVIRFNAGEGSPPSPGDLEMAVGAYQSVWQRTLDLAKADPDSGVSPSTYHAINAAALAIRGVNDAARAEDSDDGAADYGWASGEAARALAEDILRQHEDDLKAALQTGAKPSDMWTLATCGEAYLVLGYDDDAALCYGAFAGNPSNDAFKLASALRQLEQVWEISGEDDTKRGGIVRILKTAILNVDKGAATAAKGASPEDTIQTEPVVLSPTEAGLIRRDLEQTRDVAHDPTDGFQAYFEKRDAEAQSGRMLEIDRLLGAMERVRSICAIQTIKGGDWEQIGSGFVIDGGAFRDDWAGQPLIATNYHVVGDRDGVLGASFMRSRAIFYEYDAINRTVEECEVNFAEIVWFSPETQHDITLLKPKTTLPSCANPLTADDVSDYLPARPAGDEDGTGYHVVVLGFPLGGEAKFSFDDELLLDHSAGELGGPPRSAQSLDGRPEYLHYRTPTEPGSSGSPVFDSVSWKLMGIHHKGSPNMRRIPNKTGRYEANQGVWLASIRARINAPDAILDDPAAAGGNVGDGPEFLAAAGAVAGAIANRIGSADFPGASASTSGSRPGDDVVLGKPMSVPGRATEAPASPPKSRIIPGRKLALPGDDPGLVDRLLKKGHYSGDLETFRQRSAGFETVIGDDNRTQIHATTAYPFRLICSLVMHWPGNTQTVGTGFLVGQRTVLTAGHCILPSRGSPYPIGIEIRPGRSGQHEPYAHFGQLYAEKISLHQEWSNRFDPRFDIGALHLNKEIGEDLGWFRVAAVDPEDLKRQWVHVTGYPGDKVTDLSASGAESLYAAELWHHATPIETVHDGRVYYPADTFGGQSGSPVYTYDEDGVATVIGVHAYGIGSGSQAFAYENNSAGWVDSGLLQVISDWRTL